MSTPSPAPELILAIFVHGFKGGSDTFSDFPQRLRAILAPCGIDFEPVVYPAFDTRGELRVAVDNHITWLTKLVAEKKAEYREKGGKGPVRIILLGHSMGGLVISDVLLSTISTSCLPILGLIAYDSPLLGLNPQVFKSTFDKAMDITSKGQAAFAALGAGYGFFKSATGTTAKNDTKPKEPSTSASKSSSKDKGKSKEVAVPPPTASTSNTPGSGWGSVGYLASAAIAGTAAAVVGAGWYNRDKLVEQWGWATSHLSFVGELWKVSEMEERLEGIAVDAKEKGIGFHCFYTLLPPTSTAAARTFLILPTNPLHSPQFSPSTNTRANDEITAHVDMFDKSDGVYELGRETARLVSDWVEKSRKGEMGYWEGDPVEEKGKEKTTEEEEEDERMV